MRVRFGDCVFDSGIRQVTRSGKAQALSPKAFELLHELLEARPNALSRAELCERLWPDTFVSQTSLTGLVKELRRVLGDDARSPRWIQTHHRFGYAFRGEAVHLEGAARATRASPAGCWLVWGRLPIALPEGEHVLGRDPDAVVCISSPKASRRHARIVVQGGRAVLEDLGSRNGTFVGTRRVEAPTVLANGNQIHIGSEVLVFRVASGMETTESATRG
jgi:DNA-binding winged helix-turn-helix (wHTH) protein